MRSNEPGSRGRRRPAGRAHRAFAAVLCLAAASCATAEGDTGEERAAEEPAAQSREARPRSARPPLDRAWVIFGADTVVAEVARTSDERAQGLMYRDEVPDGTGMLFVFPDSQVRSFWMANTYVALDIAYMDPSYAIVDIIQMEPLSTDSKSSAAPAMLALEVRQGWFEEQGIQIGAVAVVEYGLLTGG